MRAFSIAIASLMLVAGCAGIPSSSESISKQAVAPTGKLRVGMLLVANHATKDPATGELRGVAVDLGREAARRLGVPFEPVTYDVFADL